jgi:hypothetical protein
VYYSIEFDAEDGRFVFAGNEFKGTGSKIPFAVHGYVDFYCWL